MLKALKFIFSNLLGFCMVSILTYAASHLDLIPAMPAETETIFGSYFYGGIMWAWIIGAILSILSFSTKGAIKLLLLLLPILAPLFYGLGVLMFFN